MSKTKKYRILHPQSSMRDQDKKKDLSFVFSDDIKDWMTGKTFAQNAKMKKNYWKGKEQTA